MTTPNNTIIINHPDTGFISVAGDDSLPFLQSIITANVETLDVGACRPCALLTPQGRVLIDMMVYRLTTNQFILRCDSARRDDLFARLRRYRLRRPVELAIEPDIKLYLWMNQSPSNQPLEHIRDHLGDNIKILISCKDPRSLDLGTHILAKDGKINETTDQIDAWHKNRIAACIPEGATDLTPERALMLEAGLDLLGAVDFDKGCYVGQEVTARTHYRGLVKRRLVPLTVTGRPPALNSDIVWNNKIIGSSKTAAPHDDGMAICLALLKLIDIHAILDSDNGSINNDSLGPIGIKTGGLTVNGNPAALAIPDWMMPLPNPARS